MDLLCQKSSSVKGVYECSQETLYIVNLRSANSELTQFWDCCFILAGTSHNTHIITSEEKMQPPKLFWFLYFLHQLNSRIKKTEQLLEMDELKEQR